MCGIAGIYQYKSGAPVEAHVLQRMLRTIRHRGPDDSDVLLDGACGIGMVRLKIIDLDGGRQPMRSHDGRYSIVFNGEIYNYKELRSELERRGYPFRTHSDTEVILAIRALEEERLEDRLRGMFAFALYDHRERTLDLCRDRLGKKPLFWAETSGGVVFASEVKAILSSGLIGAEVNWRAVSDFLTLSYVPGDQSAFADISQVPPAHTLRIDTRVRSRRYWKLRTLPETEKSPRHALAEWQARVADKLAESVRYRMVSDVPVGVFLSGGIDSAMMLALALKTRPSYEMKTYTIALESPTYDESATARWVAQRFNVPNESIHLTPEMVSEHFEQVVWSSDNLLANPAMYANYHLSRVASREIKVALNGGGGDELFFGYPTYQADRLAQALAWVPNPALHCLRAVAMRLPASHGKLSTSYKLRKFLEGAAYHADKAHYWWRTIYSDAEKADVFPDSPALGDTYDSYRLAYSDYDGTDDMEMYSYADLAVWWVSMGHYQADAMSMANSLELRVPMMDHELVELAFQMPRRLKFQWWKTKPFLRNLGASLLPTELLTMKKSGFHIPLAEWFAGPLQSFVRERLADDRIRRIPNLRLAGVRRVLDDHMARRADNSFKINNLLVLVEWYHQFILGNANDYRRAN